MKVGFHIFNKIINVVLLVFCMHGAVCAEPVPDMGWVVVLDAGHGGKDPGAVCGRVYEKTINLAVALELGRVLEAQMPDIKVIYTRRDDRFVELSERTKIANKAEADLFVSIHTNANPNKNASGTETYVMGADKNSANLAVSMRENGVISLEADYESRYEGYDPSSSESLIIFSLMQYAFQTQSLSLARDMEAAYKSAGLASRGVHQAGFLVLWRTAMPGILTELGFISNPNDIKRLTSTEGQQTVSRALCLAMKKYIERNPKQNFAKPKPSTSAANVSPAAPATAQPKPSQPLVDGQVKYSVQVLMSSSPIEINSTKFGRWVMQVRERKVKNVYKYYVGELDSYKEALLLQSKLRETYLDAFMVAFDSSGQISIEDAKKITEK